MLMLRRMLPPSGGEEGTALALELSSKAVAAADALPKPHK